MKDLIYRETAIAELFKAHGIGEAHRRILSIAAVDAAPVVHGFWKEDPGVGCFWICSACGYPSEAFAANVLYKYCPRCGAKMEEQNG